MKFLKNRESNPITKSKTKQQLLAQEIFSPITTKFQRERIAPL